MAWARHSATDTVRDPRPHFALNVIYLLRGEFAEAWNARATAYYMAGEFGPSVADIARVLTLNPRHFGALSGLAMILEESGKPEKALEVYRAALAIHPHLQGATEAVERLETEAEGQEL